MRDNRIIRSRHLHRLQRRHFIIFDVLPFFGTLGALGLLFYRPIGAVEIGPLFGMWLLTGLGLTVGYHRLFTHRAFSTGTAVSCMLIIIGSMAGRGSMLSWVAMHRRHHELSDHEGDLHSPNLHGATAFGRLRGFLHAHLTWMIEHDYPNVAHYVPDLMADRVLLAVNRYYHTWVLLGLLIPAAIGGLCAGSWWGVLSGFLWGGIVRMFVVEQAMSTINSVMHSLRRATTTAEMSASWRGWRGARAGTTITMPSRIRRRSGFAGSNSIPGFSSYGCSSSSALRGTSRCPVPRRLPFAGCSPRLRGPIWNADSRQSGKRGRRDFPGIG
jgi:stearoyl-CoA desaturase (delta-9 desaturase)